MSENETFPGLLLINEMLPELVVGLRRFLRTELAYLQERKELDTYSDLVTAACEVAGGPVPASFPVLAAAKTTVRGQEIRLTLEFPNSGLLMIARAIARGIDILPVSFVVKSDVERQLLWQNRNTFLLEGEGVGAWSTELEKFNARTVSREGRVTDLLVNSTAPGICLRAASLDVLHAGADDDDAALTAQHDPLPRENLAALVQEGLSNRSPSFIIKALTPPEDLLADMGFPDSRALRKVFASALALACEKPVSDFVACLPEEAQSVIARCQGSPGTTAAPSLDLDGLIRCLYLVGNLTGRQLADLDQAMAVIPLVRGVFSAFATPDPKRFANDSALDLRSTPTLDLIDDFRTAIINRTSAHKALSVLLEHLTASGRPLRPATLRALLHCTALPPIEMISGLEAYHQTYPKAPTCTLAEFGHIMDCLYTLEIETPIEHGRFTKLAAAIAPVVRPSLSGLTLTEAAQTYDMISWIADCLEVLAGDLSTPTYSAYDFTAAAFSIVFAPNIKPTRLRAILTRWHLAITAFQAAAFTTEISCDRYRDRISAANFPHFLKGPATVDFSGVAATVTPITTADQLLNEGGEMQNCVASLRNAACSGFSLLVSIQTADARSTAEFRPVDDGYELVRVAGRHSGAAYPTHIAIAESLEEHAMAAPYAREMLPSLLDLSRIEDLPPADYMSDDEYRAYKDLLFSQIRHFLTPSEGKMNRCDWTADLLPLHVFRLREDPGSSAGATPRSLKRFMDELSAHGYASSDAG